MTKIFRRATIITVASMLLLMALQAVSAKKTDTETKAAVFRSSETTTFSTFLGMGAIPAVIIDGKKRLPGLYITHGADKGLGHDMGLIPSAILLTIDGYSIKSTKDADDWLAHRPKKPLQFTYAYVKDEKAQYRFGTLKQTSQVTQANNDSSATTSTKQSSIDELERYTLSLINESRRSEMGLGQLEQDPALSRLARRYADYMMSHPDRYIDIRGVNPHIDNEGRFPMMRALEAGILRETHENLGMGNLGTRGDRATVLSQHTTMMSEPLGKHNHRSILMDPNAHAVGIGIARDNQRLYLVEEFGH